MCNSTLSLQSAVDCWVQPLPYGRRRRRRHADRGELKGGMARFLGIDVSSASAKVVLAESDGTVVASAVRPHAMAHPRPGWAEQSPERDWWGGVVAACRELAATGLGDVAGVGVAALGPVSGGERHGRRAAAARDPVRHRHPRRA